MPPKRADGHPHNRVHGHEHALPRAVVDHATEIELRLRRRGHRSTSLPGMDQPSASPVLANTLDLGSISTTRIPYGVVLDPQIEVLRLVRADIYCV